MAIVADVSIAPFGEGTSLGKYAKRAVEALRASGLRLEVGAMSTTLEANNTLKIFEAVQKAKEAVFAMGVKRVYVVLRIDERRDSKITDNQETNHKQ